MAADAEKCWKHEKEEEEDQTEDGTVDIKGRPSIRSKGGRWSACSFLVVYETFERMAYFGVAPNLVLYLTNNFHQGTVAASNNVTNWYGTIMMTPILGAYIADAHLGRYWTFVFSSIIYWMGMLLLTLSVSLHSLKPPPCSSLNNEGCKTQVNGSQVAIFFLALYIIALGAGGTKPNITTLGADQFDVNCQKEKVQKISFFNWWTSAIFAGNLLSTTALVYIQDKVGFSIGYMIPTVALAIAIVIFFFGTPYYRHKLPSGSPLTRIVRVFVAAIRKLKVPLPGDPKELYELDPEHYSNKRNCKMTMREVGKKAPMHISTSQTCVRGKRDGRTASLDWARYESRRFPRDHHAMNSDGFGFRETTTKCSATASVKSKEIQAAVAALVDTPSSPP